MNRVRNASVALIVLWAVAGLAAEASAATPKKRTTTVAVGATFNDGNTESSQFNGSVVTEGEGAIGSFKVGVEGNYAENTTDAGVDETTKSDVKASGNVKGTFTPRTYGYLDGSLLHDEIADINYRLTVGPGIGAYAIKTDATKLSADIGVAYIWEKAGGETDDYPTLRVAEGFEHTFADKGKIWQTVEWLPDFEDFGKYLLNVEIGAEAAMNAHLNLRIVLQDRYDSQPAEGREHNDLTTIVGVSSKF